MINEKIEEIEERWKKYLGMRELAKVPMVIDEQNERAKPLGINILEYVDENRLESWLERCAYECEEKGLSRVGEIYLPSDIEPHPSLPHGWRIVKECCLDGICEYALLNERREKDRATPECWKDIIKRKINCEIKRLENRVFRKNLREKIESLDVELVNFERKREEGEKILRKISSECFYNYALHEPTEFMETFLCVNGRKIIGVINLEYMPNGIVEYSIAILTPFKNMGTAALCKLLEERDFNILYGDILNIPSAKALIRASSLSGRPYKVSYGIHNLQADIDSITMDYLKCGKYIDTLPVYLQR